MSRSTRSGKHRDNHTNISNNTSDKISTKPSSDEKNRSDLDTTIKEVKQEFRSHHQQLLVKRKELITRLGKAFEAVISNPEDVCEEIKNCLKEEIVQRIISRRDIERYCPDRWKKRTKPKNDKLSFSKQVEEKPQQMMIAVTQEGKPVTMNDRSSNTEASDVVNHNHEPSTQDGISVDDNNEAHIPATNHGEPKAKTLSAGDSASQDIVHKLSSNQSDKQDCSQCVEIPRQKYGIVRDAMKNSKASIFVKFDLNKNFLGANPDVYDQTSHQ
ncbi:MAG: hypothetical protein WA364_14760 [Candidatus Nitrosopolaris sp.]